MKHLLILLLVFVPRWAISQENQIIKVKWNDKQPHLPAIISADDKLYISVDNVPSGQDTPFLKKSYIILTPEGENPLTPVSLFQMLIDAKTPAKRLDKTPVFFDALKQGGTLEIRLYLGDDSAKGVPIKVVAAEDQDQSKARQTFAVDDFKCKDCQNETGDVAYDAHCGCLYQYDGSKYVPIKDLTNIIVKAQKQFRIKVVNVNRYMEDVDITVSDSSYKSDAPAIFSAFFGSSGDLATSLVNAATAGYHADDDGESRAAQLIRETAAILLKKYTDLVSKQTDVYQFCITKKLACCDERDIGSYKSYASLLNSLNLELINFEEHYLSKYSTYAQMRSAFDSLTRVQTNCTTNAKTRGDNIAKLQAAVAKDQADKKDATADQAALEKAQKDGCDEVTINSRQQDITALGLQLPYRLAIDAIKASLPTAADLKKLYLFVSNISWENFYMLTPPIFPQGDRLNVMIKIDTRDSIIAKLMDPQPAIHQSVSLDFSVRNKMLFSFSAGPFMGFAGKFPRNAYAWQAVPASGNVVNGNATYQLVQTGKAALPFGLGGFANITDKLTGKVGVGATMGAGLTMDGNASPALMAGVTGSFGEQQRLNVSFGAACIQSKEINTSLYAGNIYTVQPALDYTNRMHFGFFCAISYSVFTSTGKINLFSRSK